MELIDNEVFVKDGQYQAYYCNTLNLWHGTAGKMTSYDIGMFCILTFLEKHQYPVLQYSSHMPQVIDKQKYQEFLDDHDDEELLGLDEWSGYFNWLVYKYPAIINTVPYVTMAWPGLPTDWKLNVVPKCYLFENYYEELYEDGKIFAGMSKVFSKNVTAENKRKKALFLERQTHAIKFERVYKRYKKVYKVKHKEVPSFVIAIGSKVEIHTPDYFILPFNGFIRLPMTLLFVDEKPELIGRISISYFYSKGVSRLFEKRGVVDFDLEPMEFEIPVWSATGCQGEYDFTIIVDCGGRQYKKTLTVYVVETESFLSATEAT